MKVRPCVAMATPVSLPLSISMNSYFRISIWSKYTNNYTNTLQKSEKSWGSSINISPRLLPLKTLLSYSYKSSWINLILVLVKSKACLNLWNKATSAIKQQFGCLKLWLDNKRVHRFILNWCLRITQSTVSSFNFWTIFGANAAFSTSSIPSSLPKQSAIPSSFTSSSTQTHPFPKNIYCFLSIRKRSGTNTCLSLLLLLRNSMIRKCLENWLNYLPK